MPQNTLVRDVMTAKVVTAQPEMTVEAAADLLAKRSYGALPVVDASGALVGLLSDSDLIVSEANLHVPTVISLLGGQIVLPSSLKRFEREIHQAVGATVGDVMDTKFDVVSADDTIETLATLMHKGDVTHVPVLDAERHLVGIVARGDLVRFIAATT
jgi:CBS domain-containing protein